ncbi:MAG: hypothetical protein NTZ59_15600, partial [Bacteroidetes bacterium]|nr:hypothetical protein [Bacteroidota bacterium]
RWLVYRISPLALLRFITNQICHSELFKSNPDNKFYVADIENKHKITDYNLLELNEVPLKYLPNTENYFDEADCPLFTKIRATAIKSLSRKKQENEYSTSEHLLKRLTYTSAKRNWFNKITTPHYGTFLGNSMLTITIPNGINFEFNNQYNPMKFLNSNINPVHRVKKRNKVYA